MDNRWYEPIYEVAGDILICSFSFEMGCGLMSIEIGMQNTGLISPNYDVINKANKILAGKTAEDLKANTSGTMRELSAEEVREMREKARNEQRTLNVDRSEIVNNVYCKTGDNITYNVDGVFLQMRK